MFVPLPLPDDVQDGENIIAALIQERLESLARVSGKEMIDLPEPFVLTKGLRYIAMVSTGKPHQNHSVAIDENGIVFDPDPDNEHVREPWTKYRFLAVLEFRPMATEGA